MRSIQDPKIHYVHQRQVFEPMIEINNQISGTNVGFQISSSIPFAYSDPLQKMHNYNHLCMDHMNGKHKSIGDKRVALDHCGMDLKVIFVWRI